MSDDFRSHSLFAFSHFHIVQSVFVSGGVGLGLDGDFFILLFFVQIFVLSVVDYASYFKFEFSHTSRQ